MSDAAESSFKQALEHPSIEELAAPGQAFDVWEQPRREYQMALTEMTDKKELAAEGAVEQRKRCRIRHGAVRTITSRSA